MISILPRQGMPTGSLLKILISYHVVAIAGLPSLVVDYGAMINQYIKVTSGARNTKHVENPTRRIFSQNVGISQALIYTTLMCFLFPFSGISTYLINLI